MKGVFVVDVSKGKIMVVMKWEWEWWRCNSDWTHC